MIIVKNIVISMRLEDKNFVISPCDQLHRYAGMANDGARSTWTFRLDTEIHDLL